MFLYNMFKPRCEARLLCFYKSCFKCVAAGCFSDTKKMARTRSAIFSARVSFLQLIFSYCYKFKTLECLLGLHEA